MKREKHDYSHAFKVKVGMEALKDRNTIGDLALKYNATVYSIFIKNKIFCSYGILI